MTTTAKPYKPRGLGRKTIVKNNRRLLLIKLVSLIENMEYKANTLNHLIQTTK